MRRIINVTTSLLLVLVVFPFAYAHAEDVPGKVDPLQNLNTTARQAGLTSEKGGQDLPQLVGNIINTLLGFLGLIALVLILYAGFTWMTSGGSVEKIKTAKGILTTSIIGLAIIMSAAALTNFVVFRLIDVTGN